MAQQSWLYADDGGTHYNIGLYHGDESGHVIVYCNGAIVVVDFSIKSKKDYSFYVGEEFFELGLLQEETEGPFSYELKINHVVKSPLNMMRNKVNQYHNYLSVGLAALFVGGIVIFTYFLSTTG